MIQITSNPFLVTAPDTNDHELELSSHFPMQDGNTQVAFITVLSGTFKFAVNDSAANSPASFTSSSEKLLLTFDRNNAKLHCKAATAGETFLIHF